MDDDGLPIIGHGVDYTKVPPIQQKRTLAFLNYFLTRTTSFLNHFATVCDEKLEDLLVRIQRLEASMCILEAKLSSIPGLENVTAGATEAKPEANDQQSTTQATAGQSQSHQSQANGPTTDTKAEPLQAAATATQPPAAPTNTVSKDPRFSKYFKMLNFGIPLGAVQIKMRQENVDPSILDNPDAPAPPGAPTSPCPADDDSSDDSSLSN
ncbi:WASH complex subunit 3 [Dermacentor andersoni]|uniref:WASH complex subunit 3 n=1 Tax=Dermacentor andersoni TaxID=34620 RepID=UPI002154FA01|nr:WASH complex subunit 3-like [Dermacentor andersoni]